jgi:hypothetical protein
VTSIDQSVWSTFKDLELADPSFHQLNKIDLLLSLDVMFAMIKNGKIQCGNVICPKYNFWLGYWWGTTNIANTTNHHEISQRFWELEEIFPSANRLTAEKAACVQYFIDSNQRAEDERYTVNQPMKQTKNQPLAIEPLQFCTNHKPNMKSAVSL